VPRPGGSSGSTIELMLNATKDPKILRYFPGFENLVSGFRNGTQYHGTMFEVMIGAWCATQRVTASLEFSPPVQVKGKIKVPEFRWHTALGVLYGECKTTSTFNNALQRRMKRLFDCANNMVVCKSCLVCAAHGGVQASRRLRDQNLWNSTPIARLHSPNTCWTPARIW
jgi:hypothetical protein